MRALLVLALLFSPALAGDTPPWVEDVAGHLQEGRGQAGVEGLERRDLLDAAAQRYAEKVAALPHGQRLVQKRPIGRELEEAGVEHFRQAKLHLDMGMGFTDYGRRFSESWTDYKPAWRSATDARFDAVGVGAATGEDGWVVFVAILVDDIKIPSDLPALEALTIEGINAIREEHGLEPLTYHEGLTRAARRYSEQMARHDFFSHTGIDGSDLEDRAVAHGLKYRFIAENLHSSKGYDDPVPVALDGWMKSKGHRKNILDGRHTHTGVGIAMDEKGRTVFTQLFMLPRSGP